MFGFIEHFLDAPVESFTDHTCRHKDTHTPQKAQIVKNRCERE